MRRSSAGSPFRPTLSPTQAERVGWPSLRAPRSSPVRIHGSELVPPSAACCVIAAIIEVEERKGRAEALPGERTVVLLLCRRRRHIGSVRHLLQVLIDAIDLLRAKLFDLRLLVGGQYLGVDLVLDGFTIRSYRSL